MEVHFILYKPAVPGNIGAAARALKTMGFKHLSLIEPCEYLSDEARMLAHASHDVLEAARVFGSFEEATEGLDLVIATTAKARTAKHDYHSSREILEILNNKEGLVHKAGILFGSEESGLPNEMVLKSDLAMSIPMSTSYPSLNLAQSVMITAYELSPLNMPGLPGKHIEKTGEGWGTLKLRAMELLRDAGIKEGSPLHHRIMERLATVGANDIPLFLSVLARISPSQRG